MAQSRRKSSRARRGPQQPRPLRWFGVAACLLAAACVVLLVVAICRGGAILPAVKHPASILAASFAAALGGLYLTGRLKHRHAELQRSWVVSVSLLAASSSWVLLSALWSIDPVTSVWEALVWIGATAFLVAGRTLVKSCPGGRTAEVTAPAVLVAVGTALAALSLVSYAQQAETWTSVLDGVRHIVGPFGYANAFAGLLIATLAGTFALAVGLSAAIHRRHWLLAALAIGLGGAAVAQAAALVLTRSRGAISALAIGVGLGILLAAVRQTRRSVRDKDGRETARALIVALLLVAALAVVFTLQVQSLDLSRQSTEQHRVQLWQSAIDAASDRPLLGWGAGTFYQAYSPYRIGPESRYAHNLFLQHWVETGLVGCALLLAALVAVFWPRWRMPWRKAPFDPRFWLWIGAVSLLVQNLVDLSIYFPAILWLVFFVGGALSQMESSASPTSSPTARKTP